MTNEASFSILGDKKPVAADIVLSRVRLHVYARQRRYAEKFPFTAPTAEHALLSEIGEYKAYKGLRVKVLLPLGFSERAYQIGYIRSYGYTSQGELRAGIANAAKFAASRNTREGFLQSIDEARQHCPPFQQPDGVHPHIARMRWFAQQSAFGPALDHADMALQASEVQNV